jgi:hypothetical protein
MCTLGIEFWMPVHNDSVRTHEKLLSLSRTSMFFAVKGLGSSTKQFLCTDRIMCPPASKILYCCVFTCHQLNSELTSPIILVYKKFDEHILRV